MTPILNTVTPITQLTDCDILYALTSTKNAAYKKQKSKLKKNIILPKLTSDTLISLDSEINLPLKDFDGNLHYLSPASTLRLSDRTVNEGDLVYGLAYKTSNYMHLLEYERVPSVATISIPCTETILQRTVAIVKPEAMKYEEVILRAIVDAGFTAIRKRYLHLTPEQVSEIYYQYYGTVAFPYIVVSMSAGTVLALSMARKAGVEKWKKLVGPKGTLRSQWFYPMSMRARFGLKSAIPGVIHASETLSEANKENRYINPDGILEPRISQEAKVWDYCNMCINPTLLNGLADTVRVKPIDPILHLANWLLKHNPCQPQFPKEIAVLPT